MDFLQQKSKTNATQELKNLLESGRNTLLHYGYGYVALKSSMKKRFRIVFRTLSTLKYGKNEKC